MSRVALVVGDALSVLEDSIACASLPEPAGPPGCAEPRATLGGHHERAQIQDRSVGGLPRPSARFRRLSGHSATPI